MNDTVHAVTFENTFNSCPVYRNCDGYHTMPKHDGQKIRWLSLCPSCHEVFDIGQTVKD
ncbi:MAG: hypothetical protein ACN4GW_19555 [Desulforhopalus sp.]